MSFDIIKVPKYLEIETFVYFVAMPVCTLQLLALCAQLNLTLQACELTILIVQFVAPSTQPHYNKHSQATLIHLLKSCIISTIAVC